MLLRQREHLFASFETVAGQELHADARMSCPLQDLV